jgi:hypothetical protein
MALVAPYRAAILDTTARIEMSVLKDSDPQSGILCPS